MLAEQAPYLSLAMLFSRCAELFARCVSLFCCLPSCAFVSCARPRSLSACPCPCPCSFVVVPTTVALLCCRGAAAAASALSTRCPSTMRMRDDDCGEARRCSLRWHSRLDAVAHHTRQTH